MNSITTRVKPSLVRFETGRLPILASLLFLSFAGPSSPYAQAQVYGAPGTTTLTDPLVPGASSSNAGQPAAPGLPPPPGSGALPLPINPGQLGIPTFEPWASRIPANQIDQLNSPVALPFDPSVALPPGVAGPICNPPAAPSTPGADPGMLRNPSEPGYQNSTAAIVNVPIGGRYPANKAPTTKRPGATTQDFGLPRTAVNTIDSSTLTDFGQRLSQKAVAVPPTYTQDGRVPVQPQGKAPQKTDDLYGTPMLSTTNGGLTPLTTVAPY